MTIESVEKKFITAIERHDLSTDRSFFKKLRLSYTGGLSKYEDLNLILSICELMIEFLKENDQFYDIFDEDYCLHFDKFNLMAANSISKKRKKAINSIKSLIEELEGITSTNEEDTFTSNVTHLKSSNRLNEIDYLNSTVKKLKSYEELSTREKDKAKEYDRNKEKERVRRIESPTSKKPYEYPKELFILCGITYLICNIYNIKKGDDKPKALIKEIFLHIYPSHNIDSEIIQRTDDKSPLYRYISNYESITSTKYFNQFFTPLFI